METARAPRLLAYLEVRHALGHVDAELDHVEDLAVEHAHKDEVMRPLLGVEADEEERGVVLLAPELERLNRLERVDVVLLREVDGLGALKGGLNEEQVVNNESKDARRSSGVSQVC